MAQVYFESHVGRPYQFNDENGSGITRGHIVYQRPSVCISGSLFLILSSPSNQSHAVDDDLDGFVDGGDVAGRRIVGMLEPYHVDHFLVQGNPGG